MLQVLSVENKCSVQGRIQDFGKGRGLGKGHRTLDPKRANDILPKSVEE